MSKNSTVISALVLMGVVPFFLKNSEGERVLTKDFFTETLSKSLEPFHGLKGKVVEVAEEGISYPIPEKEQRQPPAPGEIYKWQDADGKWHFGDAPVHNSQRVHIDTNANVVHFSKSGDQSNKESRSASFYTIEDSDAQKKREAMLDKGTSGNPIERVQGAVDLKSQVEQLTQQIEARNKAMDESFIQ